MSARNRGLQSDPGWFNRRFAAIERDLRELAAARSLQGSSFPPGIIPTTALASPVAPGGVQVSATGFGVATAGAVVTTLTLTVPAQMTGCSLLLAGGVYAVNSTAAGDYLLARCEVNASTGLTTGVAVPIYAPASGTAGNAAQNSCRLSALLTGLNPGDTFDVRVWASTSTAAWAANANNSADLSGSVGWYA